MDFQSGMAWVGNIRQKIETLSLEVDDIMGLEPFKHVEDQLLTVSTNAKRFYSEFVQDALPTFLADSLKGRAPDVFLEQIKNTDLMASLRSNVGIDGDRKMGLCDTKPLSHASFVEPVEGSHIDSSLMQNAAVDIYEKPNVDVNENLTQEKNFCAAIPEVYAFTQENLSMETLIGGMNLSNDKGQDDQVVFVKPEFVNEFNSCLNSSEISNFLDSEADISSAANSVIFAESSEFKFPDGRLTSSDSGDTLSTVSNERSDDANTEEVRDYQVTEPGIETTQPCNELKFDLNCIMVDANELRAVTDLDAEDGLSQKNIQKAFASKMKCMKKKECERKATCSEDLHAESDHQITGRFKQSLPTGELESQDPDFCESDWEII